MIGKRLRRLRFSGKRTHTWVEAKAGLSIGRRRSRSSFRYIGKTASSRLPFKYHSELGLKACPSKYVRTTWVYLKFRDVQKRRAHGSDKISYHFNYLLSIGHIIIVLLISLCTNRNSLSCCIR
jgi:hypothetical protein